MTNIDYYYLTLATGIAAALLWFGLKRYFYVQQMRKPFPAAWQKLLSGKFKFYRKQNPELQRRLEYLIKDFLYKKHFIGCQGQHIDDEVKVLIAAGACLLILNRPSRGYAGLKWIYVYPTTFVAEREEQDEYGVVSHGRRHLLGESWHDGKVILAWDEVEYGIYNESDGDNVVLHEFAHQLDQEDGISDGAPLLYTKESYAVWSNIFNREFDALRTAVDRGEDTLIDSYGATNAAEFFAVVTELFFEKPAEMREAHPELYGQLKQYYRLDPGGWN